VPDVVARDIALAGPDGASFTVDAGPGGRAAVRTRLRLASRASIFSCRRC
jgi:hypothetical protein